MQADMVQSSNKQVSDEMLLVHFLCRALQKCIQERMKVKVKMSVHRGTRIEKILGTFRDEGKQWTSLGLHDNSYSAEKL